MATPPETTDGHIRYEKAKKRTDDIHFRNQGRQFWDQVMTGYIQNDVLSHLVSRISFLISRISLLPSTRISHLITSMLPTHPLSLRYSQTLRDDNDIK
jgi:hypothetical protein